MRRVRKKAAVHQRSSAADVIPTAASVDDRSVAVELIQALIPLGFRAVEDALQQEVVALAGARYAHADGHGGIARWGSQAGSIFLLDQKVPITVPRVRDVRAGTEVALTTYAQWQTPRTQDVGLFRRVLGGLSCREYEGAAEAVPEAFGLAKSSVSRRFIRASATALQALHERRHDDAEWLVCKYTQIPAAHEQANSRSRRELHGAGALRSGALPGGAEQGAEFPEPIALAVDVHDRDVVQQAIQNGGGQDLIPRKDLRPVAHMLVGREQHRAAFVARRDQAKEEIGLHAVERSEVDFIDDQEAAIEVAPRAQARGRRGRIGFQDMHQIVEHDVRDAEAVLDRRDAEGRRQVTFLDTGETHDVILTNSVSRCGTHGMHCTGRRSMSSASSRPTMSACM